MFLRFCFLLFLCGISSCSRNAYLKAIVPSIEDKWEAAELGEKYWKGNRPFKIYGRARSHQLLELDKLEVTDESANYDGSVGLASVITADGYALTAAHVIDEDEPFCILQTNIPRTRAHMTTLLFKKEGTKKVKEIGYNLSFYPKEPEQRDILKVRKSQAIRVVHTFSGDLALVKLPASPEPYFQMSEMPQSGEWVFASGAGVGMSPGRSAGKVLAVRGSELLTTLPAAPGDSGGPIFDSRGRLIGVFSASTNRTLKFPLKKGARYLQQSIIEIPDRELVKKLIAEDRAKYSSQ